MVCSPGSGRMAVMARLLAAGSFSQTIAEEVCHQKLAAQYIHRELREADEANLLDEEDMHVFDLKPMTDPLHLVCCNACKKPIRASQYAAHAGLCRSLNSAEEIILELDGGTGHKKPPKERKKLLSAYANVATSVGEQERFESVDANDISASESHLDEVQMTSSFFMETKRNSSCVDAALVMDGSGISPGNTDYSAGAMPPPTKRSKLMAAEALLLSDPLETASDVTKSLSITTQEALTCREFARGSSAGIENICDHVVGYQKPRHVHEYCLLIKDVPVPLATKMFYSQRNHRLRSALCHLHYESSTKGRCVELVNPKVLPGNTVPAQTSSPKNFSHEIDEHQDKKPDQILAQSSEVYPGKSGGCPPAMNLSNQVPMNNVSRSRTAPVGMMRSNFLLKPYSLAGNSGCWFNLIKGIRWPNELNFVHALSIVLWAVA